MVGPVLLFENEIVDGRAAGQAAVGAPGDRDGPGDHDLDQLPVAGVAGDIDQAVPDL
ncbi:hypothetical protein [Phytoactinopolyspora mesophila]|uniref:Uncharacterized protein n=1 Tax=Phytoactinopolyspora mesophila TaxID=2650750 RepID=A0A7K3M1N5_9ACTN|nr:hypothetical protein [Phytoactinopolyspora mesophila]NDL57194.1 hypothetical protein [Phytoactinopolyspora mesophila]